MWGPIRRLEVFPAVGAAAVLGDGVAGAGEADEVVGWVGAAGDG